MLTPPSGHKGDLHFKFLFRVADYEFLPACQRISTFHSRNSPSVVPQELLDAHIEQTSTSPLQRAMCSNAARFLPQNAYSAGDTIWVWYTSSKGNERDEWIPAIIERTFPSYVEARSLKDGQPIGGQPMKPAYADLRLAPRSALARELMRSGEEEELGLSADGGSRVSGHVEHPPTTDVNSLISAKLPEGISPNAIDTGFDSAIGPDTVYMQFEADNDVTTDDMDQAEMDIDRPFQNLIGRTEGTHTLESDRARILDEMFEQIGSNQVSRSKLEFAPSWILDEAFNSEHATNWVEAYEEVGDEKVQNDANIVSSHVV